MKQENVKCFHLNLIPSDHVSGTLNRRTFNKRVQMGQDRHRQTGQDIEAVHMDGPGQLTGRAGQLMGTDKQALNRHRQMGQDI